MLGERRLEAERSWRATTDHGLSFRRGTKASSIRSVSITYYYSSCLRAQDPELAAWRPHAKPARTKYLVDASSIVSPSTPCPSSLPQHPYT